MDAAGWIALAQVLVAVLLTVVTLIYVMYTRSLAKAAAEQMESQSRPYIVADLVVRPSGMVLLHVRNRGRSSAQHLKLSLDSDIEGVTGEKLNTLPAFTAGLAQLAPDGAVTWTLGGSNKLINTLPAFTITCVYDRAGRSYSDSFELSLESYFGTVLPPKDEVAAEIEKLRKEVEKVRDAVKKIADKPDPLPPLGPW
jgi:hypothetical protein